MTSKPAFVPTRPAFTSPALSQAFARQVVRMNEQQASIAMTEAMRLAKWIEVYVAFANHFYERDQTRSAACSTHSTSAVEYRLSRAPASSRRGSRPSRHLHMKAAQISTEKAAEETVVPIRVQLGCTTTLSYHDREPLPGRLSLDSLLSDQVNRKRTKADGSFEQLATADYDRFHYGRQPEGLSRGVRILKTHCPTLDEKWRGIWIARRRPFAGGSLATASRAS